MMQFFNWITFGLGAGKASRPNKIEEAEEQNPAPYKWLPVISTDYCTGCALCLEVCEHKCLEMVWSFATLKRPVDCGSEGNCMDACPEDVIRMEWVSMEGDLDVGRWRESPALRPA